MATKKFKVETSEYLEYYSKKQKKQFGYNILLLLIDLIQTVIIYGYCAYLAISGGITVGSFTVFLGSVTAFSGIFASFMGKFSEFELLSKYVDDFRTFSLLSVHKGAERELIGFSETNAAVEFVNVSFKYPNTDVFVLKNINIKIKAGERLSLVGYNGAGKSTFVKLLCRLYEPTEGKIFINGVDISCINLHDYREHIAIVFQDFQLFSMTICENIVLNRNFDKKRMERAIDEGGLGERIKDLENGVDTNVGRIFEYEGREFSGGDGQKIACARAYYKDAPVVILDEPTSSLDPYAETRLYERFNGIIRNKTSIYISHRLASVKFCDSIAVFSDGHLVEYGTHKELLEKNGIYADMFAKQAYYYIENNY